MTTKTEIKLPQLSRLQVPRIDADIDLVDIRRLVKWAEDIANTHARAAVEADRQRRGEVVVTKDESGTIVVVTRQDSEGHILSVIAESEQRRGHPIAWVKPDIVENQFINMRPRRVWWECNEGVGVAIYSTPQPAERSRGEPVTVPSDDLRTLQSLLDWAEEQICLHEETHRGGAIWEICDQCGAKWADDEGGRPEFQWPEPIVKARALLSHYGGSQPAANHAPCDAGEICIDCQPRRADGSCPDGPAASAEPIGYITPAAIDLLREGRYVTLCPTSIDQGVPVFLGAELAASVGPTRCGDCPPDDEFAEDLARIDDELGIDTWEFDPGVTLEAIRELKKYVEMLEAAPVAQEPVAFLCRECDEEGWSTYAVMPHEVPSTGEFLHVEPLYAAPVAAQAQPVAFAKDGVLFWHGEHASWRGFNGDLYLAAQAQPVVNQQMTTDLLERVSDALGRFVSDEGWGQADMDLCDEFSAALAALSSVQDREDAGDPLQGAARAAKEE